MLSFSYCQNHIQEVNHKNWIAGRSHVRGNLKIQGHANLNQKVKNVRRSF